MENITPKYRRTHSIIWKPSSPWSGRTMEDNLPILWKTWTWIWLFGNVFMNTTLRAAVHLGQDWHEFKICKESSLESSGTALQWNRKAGQWSDTNLWHKLDYFSKIGGGCRAYQHSTAKVYCFSDSVFCLGKMGGRSCWILEEENSMVFGQQLFQRFESNWWTTSWIRMEDFPGIQQWESSIRFNTWWENYSVNERTAQAGSSSCQCLTTLYGMSKGSDEKCGNNLRECSQRFPRGQWSFLGPGSEKKWHETYDCKPAGSRDRMAKKMLLNFAGSGHPIFRGTSALVRGELRSKESGNKSIHFNGSTQNIELLLQMVISVNQLSIYGAWLGLDSNWTETMDWHWNTGIQWSFMFSIVKIHHSIATKSDNTGYWSDEIREDFVNAPHGWKKMGVSSGNGGGQKTRFQYCLNSNYPHQILYLRAIQGHQEVLAIQHCKTMYCYQKVLSSIFITSKTEKELSSIVNHVLIPGGVSLRTGRQVVFFTVVIPMDNQNGFGETLCDLSQARSAPYKTYLETLYQNTVCWFNLELAQHRGLQFYQTRSNVVILYDTSSLRKRYAWRPRISCIKGESVILRRRVVLEANSKKWFTRSTCTRSKIILGIATRCGELRGNPMQHSWPQNTWYIDLNGGIAGCTTRK